MTDAKYLVIEKEIMKKITSGVYKKGQQIDSENALAKMYNVSRMTARQSLNNLVRSGYLKRHKGKGTFVNDHFNNNFSYGIIGQINSLENVAGEITVEVLSYERVLAPSKVHQTLGVGANDYVIFLERVCALKDEDVLLERTYINEEKLINKIETDQLPPLDQLSDQIPNSQLQYMLHKVSALNASRSLAETLKIAPSKAILNIILKGQLNADQTLEYVELYYRTDRFDFFKNQYLNL